MNDKITRKPGEDVGQLILQELIIRKSDRSKKDVGDWRNAHRMADYASNTTNRRTALYDLYDDILLDGTLSSLVDKRIMAVTNTKLRFVRDGQDDENINKLIRKEPFKKLLREILLSKLWGITVAEVSIHKEQMHVFSIPRKHVRPDKGIVTYEQNSDAGFSYREGMYLNTILEVGEKHELGLLLKAVPYVLYKRGAIGDWAQYCEIFGMPTKIGRYSGYDAQTKKQLEAALDEAGSALSMVIPEEAKVEFLEAKSTGDGSKIYDSLKGACNEELAILLLGQTETTRSSASSGYAQASIHSRTEDDINADDRSFVLSVLESHFNHILTHAGYNMDGGEWMFEDAEENITLKDRVVIDTALKGSGLPIDDEYFYERYDIPKPANYEQLKKETEEKRKAAAKKKKSKKEDPDDEDVKQDKKNLFDQFEERFKRFFA